MNYIDLGLPSGNLWAENNEEGFYTYNEAKKKFGDNLPTKEDFEELLKYSFHRWNEEKKGLEFLSENGRKLFIPAEGYRSVSEIGLVGSYGVYWSSTPMGEYYTYALYFHKGCAYVDDTNHYIGCPVRLIQRPTK